MIRIIRIIGSIGLIRILLIFPVPHSDFSCAVQCQQHRGGAGVHFNFKEKGERTLSVFERQRLNP